MVGLLEGMDSERLSGGVSTSDGLFCLSGDSSPFQLLENIQNSISTDVSQLLIWQIWKNLSL